MSTKHVILALLDIKSMSGYDLMQNMKISLNSLWAATYSQIYPTLHKLEKQGWVSSTPTISQKGRERIEYAITDKGREALGMWFNEPIKYLPYRDPFKLWASKIDRCSPENIRKFVDQHIEINTQREQTFLEIAEGIENETHPLIVERIQTVDRKKVEEIKITRAPVFRMLARQARFEVECAEEVLRMAERLNKL